MSVIEDATDTIEAAGREIITLRSLLTRTLHWIPTEDQCCDEDRDTVRDLQTDIHTALGLNREVQYLDSKGAYL